VHFSDQFHQTAAVALDAVISGDTHAELLVVELYLEAGEGDVAEQLANLASSQSCQYHCAQLVAIG